MVKKLLTTLLISTVFIYGFALGKYKVFPYKQLTTSKVALVKLLRSNSDNTSHAEIKSHFFPSLFYISQQDLFKGLAHDYDLVFLGDSITNAGRWSEAFSEYSVANRGINGDTSDGILYRLDGIIALNPDAVFLMLGINDIAQGKSADYIFERYKQIIQNLMDNGVNVNVQSTLLSSKPSWNLEVNRLNIKLFNFAKANKLTYIDLNETLAPTGKLTSNVSPDGVHLSAAMYLKWFALIREKTNI